MADKEDVQYRSARVELRAVDESDPNAGRTVFGRAVPYGVEVVIYPGYSERFEKGAFADYIRENARTPFAWEHQRWGGKAVGIVTSLEERDDGLWYEARMSKTQDGNDLLELLRDGALEEVSIGFIAETTETQLTDDGELDIRKRARLTEISVVYQGAYGQHAVNAGVRAKQHAKGTPALDALSATIAALKNRTDAP